MARIKPVNPDQAEGKTKVLLDQVKNKLGMTPNIMLTMANSPAVLEAYLNIGAALAAGALSSSFREKIALTVAEENQCNYCLAAHTVVGKSVGISDEDIIDSRKARSVNSKENRGLQFALSIVKNRGNVADDELSTLRNAGYTDGEISEIVTTVIHNIFSNYFNHVAQTAVDFPTVQKLTKASLN